MASEKVEPGLVIAGRYRVEKQVGEGGMGSVFLVRHVTTDERLAIKVLHKGIVEDSVALERFQREARTPAKIDSDHVVRVTDADVSAELGNVPFLVMEYLRGQDLEQLLAERGPLPPSDVVLYLRQAARALDKAHALGIVHRDLKPENLFLTEREDGTPWIKLLDFGIAKLMGGNVATKTATGQIFGTPLFMSPEQTLGENSKIAPQTDIWALGLIAHKLLTGNDIWTAENLTHLIAQIAYIPLPVPSQRGASFGPLYDAWFAKCCARQPQDRYASASEVVTELAKALGLEPDSAKELKSSPSVNAPAETDFSLAKTAAIPNELKQTGGPLTRTDHRLAVGSRRRVGVGAIAAIAGVAIVGGLFWFLTQQGSSGSDTQSAEPESSVQAAPTEVPTEQIEVQPAPTAEVTATVEPTASATTPPATARPSASAKPYVPPTTTSKPWLPPMGDPSGQPTVQPTAVPTSQPTAKGSTKPLSTTTPTAQPTASPTGSTSGDPLKSRF